MIEFNIIALIILFILSIYDSFKHESFSSIIFVLQLYLLVDIADTKVNKIVKEIQYTQFRDNNYTDFSNDKSYQHWLIDHPITKKEE